MTVGCPFEKCLKHFSKKSSFSSHLSRCHSTLTLSCLDNRFKINNDDVINNSVTRSCGDDDAVSSRPTAIAPESTSDSLLDAGLHDAELSFTDNDLFKRNLALFYLKLQAKLLIPASTVQLIADEFTNIHELNQEYLLAKTKIKLMAAGLACENVDSVLYEMKCSDLLVAYNRGEFRNDYMRKKYYKQQLHYIQPKSYFLEVDNNGQDRCAQYVPVIQTIQGLFRHNSVRMQYLNPLPKKDGFLKDVFDGSVFCDNPLYKQDPNALKIILYQDAFEIVNPLGSSKKKHKVLGVYMTLADIYPHNRSTVDQMQLVLLCREADLNLKGVGWEKVLSPLIQDLKAIESLGIELFDNVSAKGSVVCVIGDNLGSHGVGGFVESFTATYFCRYCLVTRNEFIESGLSLGEVRNVDSYKLDVQAVQVSCSGNSRGVKTESVLNSLEFFHVCAPGLPPCLGHDLFEGVVDVDLFLFINHMVCVLKWFSYDYLNRMIAQFKYVDDDAANKPPAVNPKGDSLGGQAVQNWCMLRLLSLFVDDKVVDQHNEIWQLYLLLKQIVELVCCKFVTQSQIAIMQVLIEDYLDRRSAAFPDVGLRPKHHYLLHYASLTLQFGPLMHLWTLRFESKHSYFKRCIRYCQNFKNVCAMLSERHQLLQAYLSEGELFGAEIQIQFGMPFCAKLYNADIIEAVTLAGIPNNDTDVASQVTVKGCIYRKDCYIVFSVDELHAAAKFGKIVLILIHTENGVKEVFFLVEVVGAKYVCDRHMYYIPLECSMDKPRKHECIAESKLCHIGCFTGYIYGDGVTVTMKSAVPYLEDS